MGRGIRIGHQLSVYEDFEAAESPLGTPWQARVNTALTDMVATGGYGQNTATGEGEYDDSAALLSGFGPNVDIVAYVDKNESINDTVTHECELLLRAEQSSSVSEQYEGLFSFNGGVQCFAWENNAGSQAFRQLTADSGAISMGREFITGDRIRAKIIGSTITLSCIESNDAETILGVYTDSAYPTGQPGIGGFIRPGGNAAHFRMIDVRVTQLP
jgi:hypothetical protein